MDTHSSTNAGQKPGLPCMPSHVLLLLILVSTVVGAAVLLPLLKVATDYALTHSDALDHVLKFKARSADGVPTYAMGRVLRRFLMVTVLVLLVAFRRRLAIGSIAKSGLRLGRGWGKELGLGAGLGVGSLALFLVLLVGLGACGRGAEEAPLAQVLLKALGTACAVGLLEEVLFRGFVLRSLARGLGVRQGLVWSSALYSILHFFRAKVYAPVGFDPWIGLKTLAACFAPIAREPMVLADPSRWNESILPGTVGLFLVGVVLGVAALRSGRLWVSIGLHAGWVFVLKTKGLMVARAGNDLRWLYGDSKVVTGVLGWAFLLGLWVLLVWLLPANDGGTPATESAQGGAKA